jgi:hypothetical protein
VQVKFKGYRVTSPGGDQRSLPLIPRTFMVRFRANGSHTQAVADRANRPEGTQRYLLSLVTMGKVSDINRSLGG